MRTALVFIVFLTLLTGGLIAQDVDATFKIVADGQETYDQGRSIDKPLLSLWGGVGGFTDATPPRNTVLALSEDYTVRAHKDRITLDDPNVLFKHHSWDEVSAQYFLEHSFSTGTSQAPITKAAHFNSVSPVLIHNNFEEYADDGLVWFRDPWFVDGSGDQPNALADFGSPYTPTGKWNETEAAAFLQQPIQSGLPYYSCNFPVLLDYDRTTQVTTPLQRGQWSLYDIYARYESDADLVRNGQRWDYNYTTRRWEREPYRSADIKFNTGGAEVFAFYKAHMQATRELPPTRGNSQRKIDRLVWEYDSVRFYAVYESGGRILRAAFRG